MLSTSTEYKRVFGKPLSGVASIDDELAKQWLTSYMSIATLTEHHKNGVPVRIVNYDDIKSIYDYVTLHINAWKHRLEYGVNIGEAPIEDLIALDRFANSIYEFAKFQFTPEDVNSIMARSIGSTVSVNAMNFFNSGPVPAKGEESETIIRINDEGEKDPYPVREGITELLTNRIYGSKRWT